MTDVDDPGPDVTICLCCGSLCRIGSDCDRLGDVPHSIELAVAVADVLLEEGIDSPTSGQVREALKQVNAK